MKSLSRKDNHRISLMRNLATSLILYENITTTKAKAKELKFISEHLISIAKKNDLASRRKIAKYLFSKNAVKKMFENLVPRYKNISTGFINIYQIQNRLGDNASMTMLRLVPGQEIVIKPDEKKVKSLSKDKNASDKKQKTDKRIAKSKDSISK